MSGRDTVALLPTGAGKSICYQVPALALPHKTIVISPLIALMQDQVDRLNVLGIEAKAIHSGLHLSDIDRILDHFVFGSMKILYISPERIQTEMFRLRLQRIKLSLIVVDEAHCISQWGYDFRPQYLKIAEIKTYHPKTPIIAVTATATEKVVGDIISHLQLKKPEIHKQSFTRDNLGLVIIESDNKKYELQQVLNKVKGGIVIYVRNRRATIEISNWLRQYGFSALPYHAGMERGIRERNQQLWMDNLCRIIVCTNAFGMGIDKPDVRLVVHMDIPPSLEEYYQEAGRAGRDGKLAYAVAIIDHQNIQELGRNHEEQYPELDYITLIYGALHDFFNIEIGDGEGSKHIYDNTAFYAFVGQAPSKVFYCLQILEKEGWISISEGVKDPSRVMITCNHTQLEFAGKYAEEKEKIVIHMLRKYEGLFVEFVRIDEAKIAKELNLLEAQVVKILNLLHVEEVIDYRPKTTEPYIIILRPRAERRSFSIDIDSYRMRKTEAHRRISSIIEYVKSEDRCRQQIVTSYFGEVSQPCKVCDVCVGSFDIDLRHEQQKMVMQHLEKTIALGPINIKAYVSLYPFNKRKRVLKTLYAFAQERYIVLDNQGNIRIPG
jgi:ATP-dependent DNA helicase RecQ